MKAFRIFCVTYAAIALFTFGFAATDPRRVCYDYWEREAVDFCPSSVIAKQSLPAAIFWPFYWSWEAALYVRNR